METKSHKSLPRHVDAARRMFRRYDENGVGEGQRIPGSRYFRGVCRACGEFIRVAKRQDAEYWLCTCDHCSPGTIAGAVMAMHGLMIACGTVVTRKWIPDSN